ncbi:glycosyltransferase (plasmid) [Ensifer adhaerens]|uniref:glycosyltransferase n=1 Tax=Ensifer adhaerens TaxID=106592 RepID=UPI0023AA0299|nr:glycosyltransferase [Ensifer adhaerens]WDZ80928.1 glycosyltransferase [Ensifer adhaerens]
MIKLSMHRYITKPARIKSAFRRLVWNLVGRTSRGELRAIRDTGLLDPEFYLTKNPDVAASKIDPAVHYLNFGWREGRDPSARFSTKDYLAENPDVSASGINPLVHYSVYGRWEKRKIGSRRIGGSGPSGFTPSKGLGKYANPSGGKTAKAVFVVHDLNVGGAPNLLASIARWFQSYTSFDVRIVAMTGGPLASKMEKIAPLYIVGAKDIHDHLVDNIRSGLMGFLGDEPAFTFVNSVVAGEYLKIDPYNAPVFSYIHEMPAILKLFDGKLRRVLQGSDHVFCGGHAVHSHLSRMDGIADVKLSNVPAFVDEPGINSLLSKTDKSIVRKRLGLSSESRLVVGCGVAHWRKQPDVFVRMAAQIALGRARDVRFVWVGHGEDIPKLKKLARRLGVADRVDFVGHREDFRDFLQAADVFALPSSEDPFPLVCLEAGLAGTPSVVFREATGMTAMIEPEGQAPAGIAVPLGDEPAFFEAVEQLLLNENLRLAMANAARERILSSYVTDVGCSTLLATIRQVANLAPAVSVIVPNYNCAPYLKQRLDSIASQTFRDVEIILLDDASTDNSRQILTEFANAHVEARLHLAETNGGSVFKAWERGIELAQADLVWIAEADDWCEPDFLMKAVQAFSPSGVRLVHGRSIPVDSGGVVAGDWNALYLDRISPGRWTSSFTAPAFKEVHSTLGRANTIPNASAVVTRRSSAQRAVRISAQFKLAGDWAFYLLAAAGGRISYCHEAVNYHRRHDTSVTASIEGKEPYFQELKTVGSLIDSVYGVNASRRAAFEKHMEQEAKRFGWRGPLPAPRALHGISESRDPGVLYCVGDLSGGGAQMFAARFVNHWTALPAPAVLFVAEHEIDNPATIRSVSPEVAIITKSDIDEAGGIIALMDDWGLDLAVSGHWWGDRAISRMISEAPQTIPWITIMHGCHENVLSSPKSFPTLRDDLRRAESYCDHWVWTAEKNKKIFDEGHVTPRRTSHIINGFAPTSQFRRKRSDLGIADDALVFTLASRAIESKGWNVALSAFKELQRSSGHIVDLHLVMIGDGPVGDALRSKASLKGLHLLRHTSHLADYIHMSDVCLLPSWFPGESLPLVLIEFLAQGKPAIVSDIGKCAWAIGEDTLEPPAGFVVPRESTTGKVPERALVNAMNRFIAQPTLKTALREQARQAFLKFDMDQMIEAYRKLAKDLVEGGAKEISLPSYTTDFAQRD